MSDTNQKPRVSFDLLKRFAGYYKPEARLFAFDMACATGIALLELVFPLITRYILRTAIPNKDMTLLL